jgi:hypothetical protein
MGHQPASFHIIRPVHAYETEVVQIQWTLADGSRFEQRVTIPPAHTREARRSTPVEVDVPLPLEADSPTTVTE